MSDTTTEEPKRGRGRPRLSNEEKARRKTERDAAKGHNSAQAYSEEQLFGLLIECEPRIREAERVAKEAADRAKAEREVLAAAFGSVSVARKKLDLFRRAQTAEGEAEARELIEMRERQRKVVAPGHHGEASQEGLH